MPTTMMKLFKEKLAVMIDHQQSEDWLGKTAAEEVVLDTTDLSYISTVPYFTGKSRHCFVYLFIYASL